MFMWEIKEEAREEGMAEGYEKGVSETNAKTIKNMLNKNWSIEEITETTELDVKEVQAIIDEIMSPV